VPKAPAERLNISPLSPALRPARIGRPPKPKMPPPPNFKMLPYEQDWYDYHFDAYCAEYPDLTDTDKITLMMASVEFVKYLRMAQQEMEHEELVSQARQHPLTQYRALMDQLSVTRKARQAAKAGKDNEETEEARKFLLKLSS
jgi:hypothetical protein